MEKWRQSNYVLAGSYRSKKEVEGQKEDWDKASKEWNKEWEYEAKKAAEGKPVISLGGVDEAAQKYADELEGEMWDAGRDAVDSLTGDKEVLKRVKMGQKDAIKQKFNNATNRWRCSKTL